MAAIGSLGGLAGVADPRVEENEFRIRKSQQLPSETSEKMYENRGVIPGAFGRGVVREKESRYFNHGFDTYMYWAKVSRAIEEEERTNKHNNEDSSFTSVAVAGMVDPDYYHAQRALRTATRANVFFLITTDILGPSNAPWAISRLGYAPGIVLYTVFGIVAVYTSWQAWIMFNGLDSYKYPLRTYADVAHRIFGKYFKILCTILQCIQLLFNVAVLTLGNGNALAQISKFRVCYSVLVVCWTLAGMILGQIRTLHRFTWVANWNILVNFVVIFATMAIISLSGVNLQAAQQQNGLIGSPAIMHSVLSNFDFSTKVVAIMQMVYAFGGHVIFVNIIAEMRHPMDFWKGMILAEFIIFATYLVYGVFIYSEQGQYTINPANQGIPGTDKWYPWQTSFNAIGLFTGLVAAGLYGNIGIKVIYQAIVIELFRGPDLSQRKAKFLWVPFVIAYWAIAFVVASGVPQINNISSLVSAVCIMQFSYSFPPLLHLGYMVQQDAMAADGPFDPVTNTANRIDTWRDWSRWKRGLMRQWYFKLFNLLLFLGGLATSGIGIYSSVTAIVAGFQQRGAATSFGCTAPI